MEFPVGETTMLALLALLAITFFYRGYYQTAVRANRSETLADVATPENQGIVNLLKAALNSSEK